ncbi:aspartyl-tRNA(Asn)/glutamyl-tRNA(Gln) amidotransferase subunit B [Microdochium nivale]|nr:aspartyl-tRNA(Asn)/glutamyl-tRNA(Gln) amidotransferase subunit B [Microdochium nivale]
MARIPPATLSRYLFHGCIPTTGCLRPRLIQTAGVLRTPASRCEQCPTLTGGRRALQTSADGTTAPRGNSVHVPLRKQLKDEAKQLKASGTKKKKNASNQVVPGWELTVGIEIHAQLNTPRKLFSPAATSFNDDPNTHVAYFDLATPGSQPLFQKETLVPALRAALALGCEIQHTSRFDRKHYFHWDQPSGYQITQYYEPFARDGRVHLKPRDGIALEDQDGLTVGIKQVQMEQDTAKTLAQPDKVHWIDFNRVGAPLIEIITHPDIHHPATAAAFVRKVQAVLNATDACVSGMEAGGLRADVNVSVRRTDETASAPLGQRTEIKNLSSFKAVEDAIIAERDRQIAVLESGGKIEGETRGWSIGATETRRLRGKEGEVDYRYMPDPDLAPVIIGDDLVAHLRDTMGELPDAEVDELIRDFGLSPKDALALVAIDSGMRVEYFWNVVHALRQRLASQPDRDASRDTACFQLAANWILHELGRLTAADQADLADQQLGLTQDGECRRVPVAHLADIISFLHGGKVTAKIAKELLWVVFRGAIPGEYASVQELVDKEGLWFRELSEAEYEALADQAVVGQEHIVRQFAAAAAADNNKYPDGKLMFLVGQMIRLGSEERIDPQSAARVLRRLLEEKYVPGLKGQ